FVTDLLNQRVQVFDGNGRFLTTWTGSGGETLETPEGLAVDGSGNVLVADTNSHRIEKFTCPTPPTYDVTGHWSGSEQQARMPAVPISADFTSTGARKFTGTFTDGTLACTVKGERLRAFRARLKCKDGSQVVLKGRLDVGTETITGRFGQFKHGQRNAGGAFT